MNSSRLEDVLARLTDKVLRLLGTLEDENASFTQPNAEYSIELAKEKENLARQIGILSREFEDIKDTLWTRLDPRRRNPTFEALLSQIDPDRAVQLESRYQAFLSLLQRLSAVQHQNASLLHHALFYNRTLLGMLTPRLGRAQWVDTLG